MDTLSAVIPLFIASAGLAGLTFATVRSVRQDRPATPPGRSDDWREEALAWSRLGIS